MMVMDVRGDGEPGGDVIGGGVEGARSRAVGSNRGRDGPVESGARSDP